MINPLKYFVADSTTAATDMSVKIVTQWLRTKPGEGASFQFGWDGNVTGSWTIEGTNDQHPVHGVDGNNDVFPAGGYSTPTQPAGSAGTTTIQFVTSNAWHRGVFTPSAGGTGVTPSGNADVYWDKLQY